MQGQKFGSMIKTSVCTEWGHQPTSQSLTVTEACLQMESREREVQLMEKGNMTVCFKMMGLTTKMTSSGGLKDTNCSECINVDLKSYSMNKTMLEEFYDM